jgi:hypothetical protein
MWNLYPLPVPKKASHRSRCTMEGSALWSPLEAVDLKPQVLAESNASLQQTLSRLQGR